MRLRSDLGQDLKNGHVVNSGLFTCAIIFVVELVLFTTKEYF